MCSYNYQMFLCIVCVLYNIYRVPRGFEYSFGDNMGDTKTWWYRLVKQTLQYFQLLYI